MFGPLMGICIAVLVYGVTTPDSLHTAEKLRKGSSWVSRLGGGAGAVACTEAERGLGRRGWQDDSQ